MARSKGVVGFDSVVCVGVQLEGGCWAGVDTVGNVAGAGLDEWSSKEVWG